MFPQNTDSQRHSLALRLVRKHGLSFRALQVALEWCGEAEVALDVVLLEMKAVTTEDLSSSAAACGFELNSDRFAARPRRGPRAFARYPYNRVIQLTARQNPTTANLRDISRGGLGVAIPNSGELLLPSTQVKLDLSMTDGTTIGITGSICYCRAEAGTLLAGIQMHPQDALEVLQIDGLLRAQRSLRPRADDCEAPS